VQTSRPSTRLFLGRPLVYKGSPYAALLYVVCRLSVCNTSYRFETVQRSGLKLYRMIGQGLGSSAADGIQKDGTVSEQWRLELGYHPFRVDRDRLIGPHFRFYRKKEARTANIMTPCYRQHFTANPMALPRFPWMTLKGHFKVTKVKIERSVLTFAPRPMVPTNKNVHHCALSKSAS